jgi:predicted  nucleic acid-binding Zn ribbon protein
VYANRALDELGPAQPTVLIVSKDPNLPASCSCEARSALVLFTTYLSECSPVRCLDCFSPVALYVLPHIDDHEHLGVLQWAADYQACDTLQMHCTTGERFGEEQLYRHDSSLSRHGRALCSKFETALRVPVYYFLHKTRSRSRDDELQRRCPSCDSNWLLPSRIHLFDFQCPSCRLLSAVASSTP